MPTKYFSEFHKYLLQNFLVHFSLMVFFTYGSLLIFTKTQNSVALVLAFALANSLVVLGIFTLGLKFLLKIINFLGLKASMILGVIFLGIVDFSLFLLPDFRYFSHAIILLSVLKGLMSGFYYVPANALGFDFIGKSDSPGKQASYVKIVGVMSALCAAVAGFILSNENTFIILFVLSGTAIIFSALIICKMKLPDIKYKSEFPGYLKNVSAGAFFGNIEFSHELKTMILPLIVFSVLGSLNKSIWIMGFGTLGAILGSYISGILKDKGSNFLLFLASAAAIFGWFIYSFSDSGFIFVIIGVLMGVCDTIISTTKDARFGRESVNSYSAFEAILPIELAKCTSRLLCIILVTIIYF